MTTLTATVRGYTDTFVAGEPVVRRLLLGYQLPPDRATVRDAWQTTPRACQLAQSPESRTLRMRNANEVVRPNTPRLRNYGITKSGRSHLFSLRLASTAPHMPLTAPSEKTSVAERCGGSAMTVRWDAAESTYQ